MRRQNDKSQVVASFFTKIPKPTSVSSQVQDLHVQVTQDSACPCHMERASDLQDILSRQIFHPGVTLTVPPLFLVSETLRSNKNNEFKGICYKWLTFQKFYLNFGVVFFCFIKFHTFSQQFWKETFLRLTDSSGSIRHGPWSVVWRWVAQGVGGWGPLPVMAFLGPL